jgi:ketosteroid isomerase-like protein
MSEENVELTHRAIDAFNRTDLDALLAVMDDDVEIVPRAVAMEGRYHGHEGVLRWQQNLHDVFPDWHAEPLQVRDFGDFTWGAMRIRGHGGESRVPVDQVFWQVAEWRNGKLVRYSSHDSEAEVLEAVGLPEQGARGDS